MPVCLFPCKGPSIKYVTLFWTNFDPPSPCYTLSHISEPPEVRHTSRNSPPFLVVHAYMHMSLQGVCLSSWDFCPGVLSRAFCLEDSVRVVFGFCPSPFCQNTSVTTES